MHYYQLRVRNAADSADALTLTSVPGGANPYIAEPPSGDGQGFDPRTGATQVGAYTVTIADNGSTANAITGFLSDGAGRYDKLGRRAYLAYGTDGTTFPTMLVAGFVTAIQYPSAALATVVVGEAQRAERNRQAFVTASATFPSAPRSAPSMDFPATTMLGGGPVRWPAGVVTPVALRDYGKWTVKRADSFGAGAGFTQLGFLSGYVYKSESDTEPTYVTDGVFPQYMNQRINTLVATEVPAYDVGATGAYVLGNCYADVYSGGTFVGTFRVCTWRNLTTGLNYPLAGVETQTFMLGNLFSLAWTNADPVGTLYDCYLYTRTISESAPLHLLAHPVSIVLGLIDDAGETWDATTAASIIAAIGADVRVFLRLTSSASTEDFIARLMAIFGFGRRMNSANAWEFFDARTKGTTAPGSTITLADLREIPSGVWDLSDASILNTITLTAQRFAVWAPGQSSTRPADGLVPVEQKRTARFQLADGTFPDLTQGIKEQVYDLPGTILNGSTTEVNLTDFVNALAAPAFDRWGYGAPGTELACLPTVTATVGDEVTLDLPFLPNGTTRGGPRIVQVVQRTNEPGGPVLRVEDAGVSTTPSTVPTFTMAPSARATFTAADVTLTNAAALTAAGVTGVVLEFAVSTSSPAVPGHDIGGILPVAPLVVTTPFAAAGSKVWVRAKSVQAGRRAGTFSAWASVSLTAVGAPSALAFTASGSDGSRGTVTWTAGANSSAFLVDVLVRPSALTSTADTLQRRNVPGSVAAVLDHLTPSASYTVTVQYVDPRTNLVAASASLTFSAGGTAVSLTAPTNPTGIVGTTTDAGILVLDGTYGADVFASVVPGVVEFYEGKETGIASGSYATAVRVALVPSVSGDVTRYRAVAPHDRLRRSITARQISGTASSGFTTAVIVDPWGTIQSPNVSGGYTLSVPTATAVYGTPGTLTVVFTNSGFPSGTTYDLAWSVDGGSSGTSTGITSGVVITTNLGSGASGKVEISANYAGMILSQKKYWGVFPT